MLIDKKITIAESELELQRVKFRHEDNLRFTSVDAMFKKLMPDGIGGLNVIATKEAKDYRNTLRRLATLQTLVRSYRD